MKKIQLALVALVAFNVGCAATPEKKSDPLAENSAWQSANADMERYFEEYDLPETLDVPPPALKFVISQKAKGYKEIRERFASLYETNDLELRSAATLRVGQVGLNFACDTASMEAPSRLGEDGAAIVEESLGDISWPILERAKKDLEQAAKMGDTPYAKAAAELAAGLPAEKDFGALKTYCESNRDAWYRAPAAPFDKRMLSQCELGIADACYVASLMIDDETKAAELAERACKDGVESACKKPKTAAIFGSLGEVATTCEEGSVYECWRDASVVDAEQLPTYTDYCFKGSGFDCMKRGLLLESDDALLDACDQGSIPQTTSIDDARAECDSGDAKACFQLGVATYGNGPRELEDAPGGLVGGVGMLGSREERDPRTLQEMSAGCDAGNAEDCVDAAKNVPHDSSDRVIFLKKACKLDDQESCHTWAKIILDNKNAPAEARTEAVETIRGACRKGFERACVTLATAYGEGKDLPASKVCAARYLFEACSPERALSCMRFDSFLK